MYNIIIISSLWFPVKYFLHNFSEFVEEFRAFLQCSPSIVSKKEDTAYDYELDIHMDPGTQPTLRIPYS